MCAVTARLYESELDNSQNAGLLHNGKRQAYDYWHDMCIMNIVALHIGTYPRPKARGVWAPEQVRAAISSAQAAPSKAAISSDGTAFSSAQQAPAAISSDSTAFSSDVD